MGMWRDGNSWEMGVSQGSIPGRLRSWAWVAVALTSGQTPDRQAERLQEILQDGQGVLSSSYGLLPEL